MKTISNLLKSAVMPGLATLLALLVVMPAFAIESPQTRQTTEPNICTRIATASKSGRATVSDKRTTLQTDFSNRLANLSTKQTEVDARVAAARDSATTKFEDKIKSLEAETGLTSVQLTAVGTFKTGVEAALTTRRAAVDDARAAYRTALVTQIATQQQELSGAVTAYQTAVTNAFAIAVADCTDTNAAATLATLKTSIKDARDTLNSARTPDTNKAAIKTLAATRDAAVKAANDTFRTTLKTLSTTLKTALGIGATPTSDSSTTDTKTTP